MTYEELLFEIEYRAEELGGIGDHDAEPGARLATGMALEALEALILAAQAARKMLREERGYEHYLAK